MAGQAVHAAPPKSLSDIKGHWAEADIQKLFGKGIITGNSNGKYEPEKSITRAEFTALLVRAMGLKLVSEGSSFADVNYSKYWARTYIETAVTKGIIIPSEIGENFFGDVPLNRIDMAVMMARALGVQPSDSQGQPFADLETPNGYINKLHEEYLIKGTTAGDKLLFKPNSQSSKADAATVVSRLVQYKADPKGYVAKEKAEKAKAQLTEERKRKAAAAGVSVDLFNNTSGLNKGQTWEEANRLALEQLQYSYEGVEHKGSVNAMAVHFTQLAKSYMKAHWNINYKTAPNTYRESIKDYLTFEKLSDSTVQNRIETYAKYKIMQQSEFFTSTDLIRRNTDYLVRGTIRFKFEEPTSDEYLSREVWQYQGKPIVKGKWYEKDIEVCLTKSYDSTEKVYKYRVDNVFLISDIRLSNN